MAKTDLENNIKSAIAVTDRESSVSYKGYNSDSAVDALRLEIPKVKNTKFDLTTKRIFKKEVLEKLEAADKKAKNK